MGRLEKIVVVTVLFLVAVILGVSLNSGPGPEETPGKGPLANHEGGKNGPRARRNAELDAKAANDPTAGANPQQPAPPNGLLNAAVTPNNAAPNAAANQPVNAPIANATPTPVNNVAPANGSTSATHAQQPPPAATPAKPATPTAFLVTREGLEATASEDWMLYTWKSGDTFKDLAQHYYGSQLHVARLRAANEGRDETKLAPGDKILISAKSATALDATAVHAPQTKDAADKKTSWAGGMYEVKAGDVLGTISTQVYGTSKKWKKIYDANRDVIGDDPNKLVLGSKLRIPE